MVVTRNRSDVLRETLQAIRAQEWAPASVLVVDNDSDDGTAAMLAAEFPEVGYYRLPENLGFGAAGSAAVAAVLVWTVATGGAGRPGSVVGGLACLGLLAVEPAVRLLDPRRRSPLDPLEGRPGLAWTALAVQLVLVAVAARVAGRPEGAATALVLAALELGLALAAGAVLARRSSASRRTPS